MSSSTRKQRFALVAVSAAFVGAGVLVPSSAFAASAPSSVSEVATITASHVDLAKGDHGGHHGDHHNKGDWNHKHKKNKKKGKNNSKPKNVKNMPGCKFYKGKVYCEHKPAPAPAPAPAPGG
jgi:hypothetical protein